MLWGFTPLWFLACHDQQHVIVIALTHPWRCHGKAHVNPIVSWNGRWQIRGNVMEIPGTGRKLWHYYDACVVSSWVAIFGIAMDYRGISMTARDIAMAGYAISMTMPRRSMEMPRQPTAMRWHAHEH